jgi:hypothetical protein
MSAFFSIPRQAAGDGSATDQAESVRLGVSKGKQGNVCLKTSASISRVPSPLTRFPKLIFMSEEPNAAEKGMLYAEGSRWESAPATKLPSES